MNRPGSFDTNGLNVQGATKRATKHEPSTAERARRFVASMAVDAEDCRLLLDILGLLPDEQRLTVEAP